MQPGCASDDVGLYVVGGSTYFNTYKVQLCSPDRREPVWPSGKALDWQAEGPRFESASALLHLQKLWSVDTVL